MFLNYEDNELLLYVAEIKVRCQMESIKKQKVEIDEQRELLDLECVEDDKKMEREKQIFEVVEDCLRRWLEER